MTPTEKAAVLNAANAARMAGRKARHAAKAADERPFSRGRAEAAEKAALEAYRAAQAAEDAAFALDPEEALESDAVWETHCIAMGAADAARKAGDAAMYRGRG